VGFRGALFELRRDTSPGYPADRAGGSTGVNTCSAFSTWTRFRTSMRVSSASAQPSDV
jgi:hypothetical protein